MQRSERTRSGRGTEAQHGLSARDLRETLDEIGICTWSLNPATGRVAISKNCHHVLGVPARCLPDHDAFQAVVHPEDRAARAAAVRWALEHGGRYSIEYRVRQADGELRWVRSHGRAEIGGGARMTRFRGIVYRIDEHRQAEARLQRLQADLIHVSRLSAMGEMASALAHELNQPLGAISNYAAACDHFLAEPGNAQIDAARTALAAAAKQSQRAGAIIRRLRDFVTRGETDRRLESVAGLIDDACDLALVGAREQGVEARIDPGPPGIRVLADRVQIQQVLVNLIRNACEALRDSARRHLAIVAAAHGDGFVCISVSDSGPGIAEAVAETLFLPFVTTKSTGMGVGLSVSRSIVLAHGGTFTVGSSALGGATFRFTLPAAED
ncbi:ATP-binding protein [Methylobacterium sp. J-048]|uniref:sensor histidine kinase n=1 Tax=Methylobacterium sp. J-048 TaxID=2836635 RepID=UPI001FB9D138|nr:ATP-binding protein [Methylobacterium sp. J-048]MCJ2056970.1 ATP-binding protein [Methylobacterium sp. J-048]